MCEKKLKTPEERFWQKVDKSDKDGCWTWTGTRTGKGYGLLWVHTRMVLAHRFIWELEYKMKVPQDRTVCHSCDNPPCVRIDHLWLGTNKHNMLDMILKGRANKKLTLEQHREIAKKFFVDGIKQAVLAREYGVDTANIRYIRRKPEIVKLYGAKEIGAKPVSPEKRQQIIDHYRREKLSQRQLEKIYNVGRTTIGIILKKANLTNKPK